MSSFRRIEIIFSVFLLLALTAASSAFAADFAMKVTDKNYLDTQGFSVFLYDSTYHPVFVDQKNTAMEMILHGQRIATNGDVRLMPTPEQWDLVAALKGRQARFPELQFQLHAGGSRRTWGCKSQHQSRQAATGKSCRPSRFQLGIFAFNLHGEGLPSGRIPCWHLPANAK